jgi:uncharacterized protein (TIRG00374 family)
MYRPQQAQRENYRGTGDGGRGFEEGYRPYATPGAESWPVVDPDGSLDETLPRIPRIGGTPPHTPPVPGALGEKQRSPWRAPLSLPLVKVGAGLLIGVGLLFLVSRFVDFPAAIHVLQQRLTTPRGIILALLTGLAALLAYSIRGARWKLFLNPVGRVSTRKAIQLYLISTFLNFLLPIRGGEVAKSLMLKRIARIPVSQSLPTIVIDKSLDLAPALFIMAIVPFLGLRFDIKLWFVLGAVSGLLLAAVFFVALAAWKRASAIALLHKMAGVLPRSVSGKLEGFATGFVDSLLMGARRPKTFILAIALTCVAMGFDGLFCTLAFWTINYPVNFATALFGYTVYNMFYIIPNPPGQVGSNEVVGLLVFTGLLHLPPGQVLAMFVFSHPFSALLLSATGLSCLSALGLTVSNALKVQAEGEDALSVEVQREERAVPL